jgi:hypothetical protein
LENSMWIHMLSFALKSQIKLQRLKSICKITMLMEKLLLLIFMR